MAESDGQQWYYLLNDKQVGPVSQVEIQALINSGVVTSSTMVWKPGMAGWEQAGKTELGPQFPFGAGPAASSSSAALPPAVPLARDESGKVPIWRCIGESFRLTFRHPVPFILGNLFFLMMNVLAAGLLGGAYMSGMMHTARKARAGQPVVFSDIFQGFERFGQVLGAGLVSNLAATLGFMFCVLPGYIIGSQFMYLLPLVAFKGASIGEGITLSRRKARAQGFNHFLFYLAISIVSLSGAILCGVGLLITAPVFPLAIAIAYGINFEEQGQA